MHPYSFLMTSYLLSYDKIYSKCSEKNFLAATTTKDLALQPIIETVEKQDREHLKTKSNFFSVTKGVTSHSAPLRPSFSKQIKKFRIKSG